ncbi:MAG TPA: hypothetical protein VFV38_44105 [Ktedonobacteraceae bacterium]|nr:hypothetical protein [Ktedonobacteraceae bacterium]
MHTFPRVDASRLNYAPAERPPAQSIGNRRPLANFKCYLQEPKPSKANIIDPTGMMR